jgi:hypothetical protein
VTRPQEPTWPTVEEVARQIIAEYPQGYPSSLTDGAANAIAMCREAWLASVDDPSTDLPGTVRTGPSGEVIVRSDLDTGRGVSDTDVWLLLVGGNPESDWRWVSHDEVRGWKFTMNIPGTPAWDAAQAVSS